MKTLVVDYGSGNLRSCLKALLATGFDAFTSAKPEDAKHADALVLPGQGHFGQVMASFKASGFEEALRDHIKSGKAFLGICVGMQILFEASSEAPNQAGLGVLQGKLQQFETGFLPVPQMQWNKLEAVGESPMMRGLGADSHAYFVHSYFLPAHAIAHGAIANYGTDVAAVVSHDNIQATQFHPEKSQRVGLAILENFRRWAKTL